MMGAPGAASPVDVTEVADRKLAALGCHRSQLADADTTFAAVRAWMAATAEEAGLPEGRLAEVFRVIDTV
jgi:LmbE family N-acetylglucosaminyl deacetylase